MNCGDRLCELCNRRRYGVLINRYAEFFKGLPPGVCRFFTLTLRNEDDLEHMHKKLKLCVRRLINHGKKYWGWQGGVVAYQATNKGRGWHDHAHLVIQGGDYVPQEELSKVWSSITRGSFVVGVRLVLDPLRDLAYILGYTLSVDGVLDGFKEEYNRVFRGARLLQSWGTWFNRMASKDDDADNEFVCPSCGMTQWVTNLSMDFFTVGARPQLEGASQSP